MDTKNLTSSVLSDASPDSFSQGAVALYDQWQSVARRRFWGRLLSLLVFAVGIFFCARVADLDYGALWQHIGRIGAYFAQLVPPAMEGGLGATLSEWFWGWPEWIRLLGDTVLMAYVGTLLGFLIAFPLSFYAARNVTPSQGHIFVARRLLEVCRTVPEMVFALIFVFAFGIGPLAGILALTLHTAGALGKLFAEVIENADMNPLVGVSASGGNWAQRMRFGILPQVFPSFLTFILLRFEINVRSSTVLGVVGAGGLGHEMMNAIRQFMYADVSAILLIILVTVMGMNAVTAFIRARFLPPVTSH